MRHKKQAHCPREEHPILTLLKRKRSQQVLTFFQTKTEFTAIKNKLTNTARFAKRKYYNQHVRNIQMEIKRCAGPEQMIIGNQYVLFKEDAKTKTNFGNKGSFLKDNDFKETIGATRTN